MIEAQTKNKTFSKADPICDQFALSESLGGDYITSSRAMKVLRYLRKKGPTTEGVLASNCNERVFLHDWTVLIGKLLVMNYVKSEMTGHGMTKLISLTENGELFMEDRLGPKTAEPVEEIQPTE